MSREASHNRGITCRTPAPESADMQNGRSSHNARERLMRLSADGEREVELRAALQVGDRNCWRCA